jgi:hypothetical protein
VLGVDQAAAPVAVLTPDLTGQTPRRLVIDIEHCHRSGVARSPRLETNLGAAMLALLTDPRWM